ncbi:MAG: 3-dehydroquinate synthase [Candidatus Nanopelagicales bacterium]|nr:3-dehydroquinate synthase [Candidatus Nanopelagicales bacterium]
MKRIHVEAERRYQILIGRGLVDELEEAVSGAAKVALIYPNSVRVKAEVLQKSLEDSGKQAILIEIPDAENAKTTAVLEHCWSVLGSSGFTRSDMIIGVGGGATTDLSGFVASTWLRGIPWIAVPTTLLGMVDAGVGGKTGINTGAGKNLVGAFHSPSLVVIDVNMLASLPEIELRSGLVEVAKVGLTSDPSILRTIMTERENSFDPNNEVVTSLIERAIAVKAFVVSHDFTEQGGPNLGREVLNYGHTFGHAVERRENYLWRHGAAVSVGIMFVAELAQITGRLSEEDLQVHRDVLGIIGLPTTYPAGHWEGLLATMKIDKKSRGDLLRFVVLDGIGKPGICEGPDPAHLFSAYSNLS